LQGRGHNLAAAVQAATEQNRLLPNQNTATMNKKIANINGRLPEEQTAHQS